eukprot:g2934.t1
MVLCNLSLLVVRCVGAFTVFPRETGTLGGATLLLHRPSPSLPWPLDMLVGAKSGDAAAVLVGGRPCALLPHRTDQLHGRTLACRAPAAEPGVHAITIIGVDSATPPPHVRYRASLVPTVTLVTHIDHASTPEAAEGETLLLLVRRSALLRVPAVQLSAMFVPLVPEACRRAGRGAPTTEVRVHAAGGSLRRAARHAARRESSLSTGDADADWHWHVPVPQVPCGAGLYEVRILIDAATRDDVAVHGTADIAGAGPALRLVVLPSVSAVSAYRARTRFRAHDDTDADGEIRVVVEGSGFSPLA